MKKKQEVSIPKSTEEVLAPMRETVSAPPNKGSECCAYPLVDAGKDATGGHWEGNGQDIKYVIG